MEIPKEQYEYQKTLADIGVQIAQGRAEISELAQKKEDFLKAQEAEATKRVKAVLDASITALDQASKNQNLLDDYHQKLQNFAIELVGWNDKLIKQQQEFEVKSASMWDEIGRKTKELEQIGINLKMQQSKIESDRTENDKRAKQLTAKERQVNDKYQTLLRTQERLNK